VRSGIFSNCLEATPHRHRNGEVADGSAGEITPTDSTTT
jgi:hypothetical protein